MNLLYMLIEIIFVYFILVLFYKFGKKDGFGPLDKRTTNQRLYMVADNHIDDITYKFWK